MLEGDGRREAVCRRPTYGLAVIRAMGTHGLHVFMRAGTLLLIAVLSLALACDSPTAPDKRHGYVALRILCDPSGADPLKCCAQTYCAGYSCPDPQADGRDVTLAADWSSADAGIARLVGPGTFRDRFITVTRARCAVSTRSVL